MVFSLCVCVTVHTINGSRTQIACFSTVTLLGLFLLLLISKDSEQVDQHAIRGRNQRYKSVNQTR